MTFIVRVLVSSVAIWFASLLLGDHLRFVPDDATGWDKVGIVLLTGLVFTLVDMVIKPIVKTLSIPLYILTLGLFSLVVNALMLMLTAWITEQTHWGLRVDGFWWALLAGFIIAIVQVAFAAFVPPVRRR